MAQSPGDNFNLKNWKLTLPTDNDNNGKVDEISRKKLKRYHHPDFFYLDENGDMVFTAPNKATSTANSSNVRSELRQMLKNSNPKSRKNNFALASNRFASKFGSVGAKLEATLKVNHVALKAYYKNVYPAYSVVVGQVHAGKDRDKILQGDGFGWGNEPLKILYKKHPQHTTGSVFWNYERNLGKENKERVDITYPVWGNTWDNRNDPKDQGISLDEEFSYSVNIYKNIMYLEFTSKNQPTIKYEINLADNVDAYGKIDRKDNPLGYAQEWMYFRVGAYNQCNSNNERSFWNPGCHATGDWKKDFSRGNYAQVTFSELTLSKPSPPSQ